MSLVNNDVHEYGLFSRVISGEFLDAAYCVSRLGTTADEPITGMRDVRFVAMKLWQELAPGEIAVREKRNDEDLAALKAANDE